MLHIALVNPPFASVRAPSLALAQLQSVVQRGPNAERVTVTEHFANIEFAKYFGVEFYEIVSTSSEALNCGLGEWIFRRAAFPHCLDNPDEYWARYRHSFPGNDVDRYWRYTLAKRQHIEATIESIIDRHRLDRSDIVGFTSMFAQNVSSFAFARAIKARNPNVITILGGANCESPMGEVLAAHADAFDYVFSGPGLVSFQEFVGYILDGQRERCTSIDGVFAGRVADRGGSTARAIGKELDIDTTLDSDYHYFLDVLDAELPDRRHFQPTLFFETSRGCWWGEKAHCTFCGLNGTTMTYRSMSPALAIEQFRKLFQHAPRVKLVEAVDNILPRSYLKDVLPFVDTPPSVYMFYEVKADISEEDFKTLAQARVLRIQPGIESLATSTLKLMKKGTTAHQNIEFLKHAATYGIDVAWNLLIGFPREDEDVYRKYLDDLPSLGHLPPPSGVFPIRFDRYSPYFVRAAEYGLNLRPLDFYELVYPFPKDALPDLAYFFADQNAAAPYAAATARWIQRLRQLVEQWRVRWDKSRHATPPILRVEGRGSPAILDTRSGALVRHDLEPAAALLLGHLTRPRRLAELTALMGEDAEPALRELSACRLIFGEHDRFVSLVLPGPDEDEHHASPRARSSVSSARAVACDR